MLCTVIALADDVKQEAKAEQLGLQPGWLALGAGGTLGRLSVSAIWCLDGLIG